MIALFVFDKDFDLLRSTDLASDSLSWEWVESTSRSLLKMWQNRVTIAAETNLRLVQIQSYPGKLLGQRNQCSRVLEQNVILIKAIQPTIASDLLQTGSSQLQSCPELPPAS